MVFGTSEKEMQKEKKKDWAKKKRHQRSSRFYLTLFVALRELRYIFLIPTDYILHEALNATRNALHIIASTKSDGSVPHVVAVSLQSLVGCFLLWDIFQHFFHVSGQSEKNDLNLLFFLEKKFHHYTQERCTKIISEFFIFIFFYSSVCIVAQAAVHFSYFFTAIYTFYIRWRKRDWGGKNAGDRWKKMWKNSQHIIACFV